MSAMMEGGRIHQVASPVEIYEQPATKFVLDLIGSVNYLACELLEATGESVQVRVPAVARSPCLVRHTCPRAAR